MPTLAHESLGRLIRLTKIFLIVVHGVARCSSGFVRKWLVVRAVRFAIDFARHCEDANTTEIAAATVERRAMGELPYDRGKVLIRKSMAEGNYERGLVPSEQYEEKRGNYSTKNRQHQPLFQVWVGFRLADHVNRRIGSVQKVGAGG
jgi:hypothetical protein